MSGKHSICTTVATAQAPVIDPYLTQSSDLIGNFSLFPTSPLGATRQANTDSGSKVGATEGVRCNAYSNTRPKRRSGSCWAACAVRRALPRGAAVKGEEDRKTVRGTVSRRTRKPVLHVVQGISRSRQTAPGRGWRGPWPQRGRVSPETPARRPRPRSRNSGPRRRR